jgi:hypothetical protein
MAIDATEIGRARDQFLAGSVDARVMRRVAIISGGALVFLVAVRLGFWGRVMP